MEFDFVVPDEVKFEITPSCNQSCNFCSNKLAFASKGRPSKLLLSTLQCFHVLENIAESGAKSVCFTGGEPFLREDLPKLAKYAKICGLKTKIFTNGTAIPVSATDFASNFVESIVFSLHATSSADDALITGFKGGFEKKIASIKRLSDAGVFVSANTIGTKKNIAALDNFVELVDSLGISFWFVSIPTPANKELFRDGTQEVGLLVEKMAGYNQHGREFKIGGALPYCFSNPGKIKALLLSARQCGPYADLMIDPKGNIRFCCASGEVIGNALSDNLKEVWNANKRLSEFQSVENLPSSCRKCEFVQDCRGGCRAYAKIATESVWGMDPRANPANLKKIK